MLNGKFFTGLPPKMIDRGGAAANRNRLESHLFWPDDTKVETAIESRIKRRNSVQLASNERPLYEKQTSMAENEVDTKKRFSKEFSQSSIQFYDNLNENCSKSRSSMLRNSVGCKKMEIAEKPTNTKLELPESIVDEAYTIAKKKQAYTSKIEFYDYVNDKEESQNDRNNLRKPKMDMNDKREMELNSKNSPKLQVKRDVRSFSEEKEQRKINNCEVGVEDRLVTDNYVQNKRDKNLNNEEHCLSSRCSLDARMNVYPKRNMAKSINNYDERYFSEREYFRESPQLKNYGRRNPANCKYAEENSDYERDNRESDSFEQRRYFQTRVRPEPKRIIRRNTRTRYEPSEERDDYEQEIQSGMHTVHLETPRRKQYNTTKDYYDDEPEYYYGCKDQIRTPTNYGNSQRNISHNDKEFNEVDLPYENSNTPQRFNNDNNNSTIKRINNPIEKQVATLSSPLSSDMESQSSVKSVKHLRSSLCFNDGAIIANNDNVMQSPTSLKYPTQRRNARSSATQRVSVGLPD